MRLPPNFPSRRPAPRISRDLDLELVRHLEHRDTSFGDPTRWTLPTVEREDLEEFAAGRVPEWLQEHARKRIAVGSASRDRRARGDAA